jgi:plastocyanin
LRTNLWVPAWSPDLPTHPEVLLHLQRGVQLFVLGATIAAFAACSKEPASAARGGGGRAERVAMATDDRAGFELVATGYRPSALPASGTVIGVVDPTALPAIDDSTHECETGRKTPPRSRAALVWIAGLDSGKSLPVEKRADLGSEDCGLDPSIVATTVGSTINVYNDDAALHRFVFKGKPVDSAVTMPFFNTGQVVASERLTKRVGFVDVVCTRHPWMRATIAVFDQPYFAVTDEQGRFSLDSVPPGSYTLMVWRPDLDKPIERKIQVTGQHTTNLDIGPEGNESVGDQTAAGDIPSATRRSTTIAAKSRAR